MTTETPDALGHFGEFGGQYVPETLMPAELATIIAIVTKPCRIRCR